MGKWITVCLLATVGMVAHGARAATPPEPAAGRFEFEQLEMAVPVRIVLYAPDRAAATRAARRRIRRGSML